MRLPILISGFIVFIISMFLAFFLKYNHFYEFMLVGLFLILFYLAKSLNKKIYFKLYTIFIFLGLMVEFVIQFIAKLWYYSYSSYLEYTLLIFLAYPLGGIVMVQTFVFFRDIFIKKHDKKKINIQILKILGLIFLIITLLTVVFELRYGLLYSGFVSFFTATLAAFFYINYKSKQTSYLKCLIEKPASYIFITLLASYVNAIIHEFPNTFARQWAYQNFPLNHIMILNIPVVVFFIGWIGLTIIPVSVYFYVLSKK